MTLEKTLKNLRKAKANFFNLMDDNINKWVFVKDYSFYGYGIIVGEVNSLRKSNKDLIEQEGRTVYLVKVNNPNFHFYFNEYGIKYNNPNSRYFELNSITFLY